MNEMPLQETPFSNLKLAIFWEEKASSLTRGIGDLHAEGLGGYHHEYPRP